MVEIKHFTAPQKMPNVQFSRRAKWSWRDKVLGAPHRGQKIIVNQSKPILIIVSIKPFTRQSFRQNYFSLRQPLKLAKINPVNQRDKHLLKTLF